ncbi:MAG: hypothetical protein ACIAS6_03215 [Phycisphaerales bacterium JB060]
MTGWLAYQGFNAARYIANDLQLFSRWDQQTVAADMAKIDSMILPAVEAYTRREGRLPASLGALVAAGDLASIPDSRAGVWMYKVRRDAFEIGVGDPPHEYPCAYRVIELDGPGNADPDLWTVRDWYHDT